MELIRITNHDHHSLHHPSPLAAPGPRAPSIAALLDLRAAAAPRVGAPTVTSDLSRERDPDQPRRSAQTGSAEAASGPLLYGTACCFIEFCKPARSRFDFDRLRPVPAPAQGRTICITAGTVTMRWPAGSGSGLYSRS